MNITLPEDWRDDEVLGFFTRHFVPIYIDLRRGRETHDFILSAFAFSILGRWLLMTAGHCVTHIEKLRATGWEIERARLMDGLNARAQHVHSVPFDYDSFRPMMLSHDPTCDYGALFPTQMAVRAMQANHVVPFAEGSWHYNDEREFAVYKILGVPDDLVERKHPDRRGVTTMFQRVDRLKRRPEGFPKTNAPMFYGKLRGDPLVKLQGMSGGPIIGFEKETGPAQYWVVAMQVSTVRTKYISGMLMKPLGEFIRKKIESSAEQSRD